MTRFKVQSSKVHTVFIMLTKEASDYVCLTIVLLTVSVTLSVVEGSIHKTIIKCFACQILRFHKLRPNELLRTLSEK